VEKMAGVVARSAAMDYRRLVLRALAEALERELGVKVGEELGELLQALRLLPTVEITVRVSRGGYGDTLRVRCIPVSGECRLAEKLGLTIRVGDRVCLVIPEGLTAAGEG
jgi:hypothetical protein